MVWADSINPFSALDKQLSSSIFIAEREYTKRGYFLRGSFDHEEDEQ
jgi:hypothetical protein